MKRLVFIVVVLLFAASATGLFAQASEAAKYFKKYDPPVTFTIDLAPAPGETLDSANAWGPFNGKWQWTKEVNGIIWKPKYNVPNAEKDQKLALSIASNDLPDCIRWTSKDLFLTMMKNGQVIPVGDLVDKYGSPLLKGLLKEFNDAYAGKGLKSATLNGKLYAIPMVMDAISSTFDQFWMRGDILKTLNLAVPDNLADFEKVMKAYRAKNPNGIGIVLTKDLGGLENVLAMYGATNKKWIKAARAASCTAASSLGLSRASPRWRSGTRTAGSIPSSLPRTSMRRWKLSPRRTPSSSAAVHIGIRTTRSPTW